MDPSQLRSLVRRVVGRTMREPSAGERGGRAAGVHVAISPADAAGRPEPTSCAGGPSRGQARTELLVAEDLAEVPDGQVFEVPAGARLTALARDEAWRRGIQLRESEGTSRGGASLRVAVGADHGGFPIKESIKGWLRELGHVAIDLGTHDTNSVDYPDFAGAVAEAVAEGRADFGVCVDGAGIGSAMAANKVPGARAAMCYDEATARNAREHNYANVLSLGGPMLGEAACEAILRAFLATPEGAPRHGRRVAKIMEIEARGTGRARPVRKVLPTPGET